MTDVLNLTIPMFSLIGIGYILKRIQFMSEQDGTVLSKFAFYILYSFFKYATREGMASAIESKQAA